MKSAEQVSEFEMLYSKIDGLYREALTLSKKSPSDPFNKFKLKITNSILASTNRLLDALGVPSAVEGFEQFDDADLPGNSDVVFVLSQYLQVLERVRCENIKANFGKWYWVVKGKRTLLPAEPPRRLYGQ